MNKKIKVPGEKPSSTKIAVLFFLFVVLLVIVAIGFRIFLLVLHSKYDGKHQFTVAVSVPSEDKTKKLAVIAVSPETHAMSYLYLTGEIPNGYPIGKYLAVPIDATIQFKNEALDTSIMQKEQQAPNEILKQALMQYSNVETPLTHVDLVRLFIYARSLTVQAISVDELIIERNLNKVNQAEVDSITSQLFLDPSLSAEKLSIEVVNGAEVPGLGNRLGRFVTNMGGNVISVTSSDRVFPRSEILYSGEKSYTVEKLAKTLGFTPRNVQNESISDIIIRIGKDKKDTTLF